MFICVYALIGEYKLVITLDFVVLTGRAAACTTTEGVLTAVITRAANPGIASAFAVVRLASQRSARSRHTKNTNGLV